MAISKKYGKRRARQINMILLALSRIRSEKQPQTDPGRRDPDECHCEEDGKHCPYCHKVIIPRVFKKHLEKCEELFKQDLSFAHWLTAK